MTASAAGTARAACPRQATGPRRCGCCSARTRRDPGGPGAVGAAVLSGEEDDMSETTPALDEAFERMAAASFELPNGFVNHGAMACVALAVLDCAGDIDSWAGVVQAWVPRLMPALRTALFHGAIRTAHAVRAIDAVDTAPRRGELARALGYWAARYREGQPASPLPPAGDVRLAVVRAAADGARRYLARPDIFHLHGVTGAMAVEILAAHIPAPDGAAALAHVHAEHAALYAATEPVTRPHPASPPGSELAVAAVRSLDPHQVKLVEACRRGHAATGDPAFAAAAETVTGLHA